MKTVWKWSVESEANRILHSARSIGSGFFHLHQFYPLPWTTQTHYLPQGVYLPHLDYHAIPDFWHHVKSYNLKTMVIPPTLLSVATDLINQLQPLNLFAPDYTQLQADWDSISPRFIHLVHDLIPYAPAIDTIEIHLSHFGTQGSFNLVDSDPAHVVVELRADAALSKLAECIITSLTRPYLYKERQATWEETEFLVDYFLQETSFAKLFPTPHHGTLQGLRSNVPNSIINESLHFLTQIGAPVPTQQIFHLHHDLPHFGDLPLHDLTSREQAILTRLITQSPAPVTTDEIADLLYPDPEKFSLAALTKCMERLRDKLEDAGISRHYIATASGVGYYLKN